MTLSASRHITMSITAAIVVFLQYSNGMHFRGGTIAWKSAGGYKVNFNYQLGWKYGKGMGCTEYKLGKLVSKFNYEWKCISGCDNIKKLHDTSYICTGANRNQMWEQGQNWFQYTFQNEGPFIVSFRNHGWIRLSNGMGNGSWNLQTVVDLRRRNDTGGINASPQTHSKPIYFVPFNCENEIKIPLLDADGDKVKCRWSTGQECASVCNSLPGAVLDENNCMLSFKTTVVNNYIPNGIYAVALTIEDFPRNLIRFGKVEKTPNDALSAISVQFLVQILSRKSTFNLSVPRFVDPTPNENEEITVEVDKPVVIVLYTDNGENDTSAKANRITASGITGLKISTVFEVPNRISTFWTNVTWKPSHNDLGSHLMCGQVENDKGVSGSERCFRIRVIENICRSYVSKPTKIVLSSISAASKKCSQFTTAVTAVTSNSLPTTSASKPTYTPSRKSTVNDQTILNRITTPPKTLQYPTSENKKNISQCDLDHNDCKCFFGKTKRVSWLGLSRSRSDLLMFLIGLPFGLFLSVFFCCLCPRKKLQEQRGKSKWRISKQKLSKVRVML